jgi:hypothetical protein
MRLDRLNTRTIDRTGGTFSVGPDAASRLTSTLKQMLKPAAPNLKKN